MPDSTSAKTTMLNAIFLVFLFMTCVLLKGPCRVMQFVVIEYYVYPSIGELYFGFQKRIAGIEHVGQQRHVVFVAVAYDSVVLFCQLHVFALRDHLRAGFREAYEVRVDVQSGALELCLVQLFGASGGQTLAPERFAGFVQRREVVGYADTDLPVVEVLVYGRNLD